MAKSSALLVKIQQIRAQVDAYESGDVMGALDIQDALTELHTLFTAKPGFERLVSLVYHLIPVAKALTKQDTEQRALQILTELSEGLELYFTGRLTGKMFGSTIRKYQGELRNFASYEPSQSGPVGNESPKESEVSAAHQPVHETEKTETLDTYPSDYFSGIIEDTKLLEQFYAEAQEHLEEAQATLVELEYDNTNKELLNTIFRSFHTIKGSSAFLGLKNIEETAHAVEDLLAIVRDGKLILNKELIDIIFYGMELLKNLLESMQANDFRKAEMEASFRIINIYPHIRLFKKIKEQYRYKKIGEILAEEGKVQIGVLQSVLQKQRDTDKKIGELLVEEKIARPEDVVEALKKQNNLANRIKKSGIVKVSNEKLNTLIDIVGELVINQSMVKQELLNLQVSEVTERSITQLESITTTIKNLVLSMGMVPIADIFNKLRVVARNTAEELGKTVYLELKGEETELDRNVIETIYEPLMHLIRNAIDHGIEEAEIRDERGKNRLGRILLSAEHKGSGIEIVVQDDGQGIDTETVVKKALEKGLIKRDDVGKLSQKDIYNLLFLPGFSTAEQVTNVSGRGVGLDVVKKNLDSIHGRVEVTSEPSKGTKFTIKLPLTLAIIEGFVTRVGDNKYVFPFSSIEEIKVIQKNELFQNDEDSEAMIFHRGLHIPVLYAHRVFREAFHDTEDGRLLSLLFSLDQSHYCVVVDELIGKQEIVVKSMSQTILKDCTFFSGGTIFGDGSIGFVVDMQGFLEALK
ncbi:chemotaxis protein CheA [Gracilinema caldarium]|uniref:Chemotaxis protein CheA n=1 Tax=Gracilinema caldarium (strain ATCC 51460 / DSM 7334 / H1) TaxID=744872 RepID=F8F3T6_GRAC1|nr:chemotaxis protein CheA [Gracilinema caldarium]AEJ20455.1 CheA signal transduction histidine kinase [Gracilinema caldarium DSM 7334]